MRGTLIGVLIGVALGFGIGWAAFEWKPWHSSSPANTFLGHSCFDRERIMSTIRDHLSKEEAAKAEAEEAEAEAKEPC